MKKSSFSYTIKDGFMDVLFYFTRYISLIQETLNLVDTNEKSKNQLSSLKKKLLNIKSNFEDTIAAMNGSIFEVVLKKESGFKNEDLQEKIKKIEGEKLEIAKKIEVLEKGKSEILELEEVDLDYKKELELFKEENSSLIEKLKESSKIIFEKQEKINHLEVEILQVKYDQKDFISKKEKQEKEEIEKKIQDESESFERTKKLVLQKVGESIKKLRNRIEALEKENKNLKIKVENQKKAIFHNEKQLKKKNKENELLSEKILGIEETMKQIISKMITKEKYDQDISKLKKKHDQDISKLKKKHDQDISKLISKEKHNQDISKMKTKINVLNKKIDNLNDTIQKHLINPSELKAGVEQVKLLDYMIIDYCSEQLKDDLDKKFKSVIGEKFKKAGIVDLIMLCFENKYKTLGINAVKLEKELRKFFPKNYKKSDFIELKKFILSKRAERNRLSHPKKKVVLLKNGTVKEEILIKSHRFMEHISRMVSLSKWFEKEEKEEENYFDFSLNIIKELEK